MRRRFPPAAVTIALCALPALLLACAEEPAAPAAQSEEPVPVADPGKAADPLDAALDDAVANAEQRTEDYAREAPMGDGAQ